MIVQRSRVVGRDGPYALVETLTKSACGGCNAERGCGVSRLGKLVRIRTRTLRVDNTAAASVGEEVMLGVPEDALLSAAFYAYVPPLAGVLGGAVLAASASGNQVVVALGAVLGLVAGVLLSRAQAARLASRFAPRMLERSENPAPLLRIEPHSPHSLRSKA